MLADIGMLLVWLAIALIPLAFLCTFGLYFFADIWIKRKTRGGTLAVFWDENRDEDSYLLKLKGGMTFKLKDGDEEPTYVIDRKKQHYRSYPYWAPRFMQVRMPTYYFTRDNTTAIDPTGQEAIRLISPTMLGSLINQNTLTVMAKVAKDTAEQVIGHVRKIPVFTLGFVLVIIALVIWNIIITYQTGSRVTNIEEIITK